LRKPDYPLFVADPGVLFDFQASRKNIPPFRMKVQKKKSGCIRLHAVKKAVASHFKG